MVLARRGALEIATLFLGVTDAARGKKIQPDAHFALVSGSRKEGIGMKVMIGSDHGGVHLKQEICDLLQEKGIAFTDVGTHGTTAVDYPDIAKLVGEAVAAGEADRGILICGTGIGISIAANKIKGIRAALCHDVYSAQMTREHNDSNILAMGERVIGPGLARMIATTWLSTAFAGDRHVRRVAKISALEE